MLDVVLASLSSGLPVLVVHFMTTIAMLVLAFMFYMRVTPYSEFAMVMSNNSAAAVSTAGALLGLALPLAFCLHGSVGLLDIVIWGSVALLLQLVTFFVLDYFMKGVAKHIEQDHIAPAVFIASIKVAVGMLNAAAISI